ncbi:hypothetical protein QBC41DRAFT_330359 [Cercophora samala]|uniref:EGF-like domain-containing protein n=1 Tax=Cercophora samala TaxID=330535 RepID=A0AA39Z0G2_9PEZI|nr:hypothetical protein QBC41DRAFT_330359 [Cercophora samala]
MSTQDGRGMDRSPPVGSIARARERAAAGLPREDGSPPRPRRGGVEEEPQIARSSRPQAPPGLQTKDGQIGVAISRPTQVPQWPLAGGPIIAPSTFDGEPYRPPPGRSQPPQRPPRPSRVPSILDGSKVQDPTPVFQYRPRPGRESSGQELLPVPETPSSVSRASTQSSVGSIPDFPIPAQIPPGPPRRSVNLGPPPSARRGVSSFYSNVSYVSPIPEESPRSRSHTSFASSAAIPDGWDTPSPGPSPQYPEAFYDDTILEEAGPFGDEEESRLVRNASVGKRAKPTLVGTVVGGNPEEQNQTRRPAPKPLQGGPFEEGTGYVDYSSSSSTIPAAARLPIGSAVTRDSVINALSSASADDPSTTSQRQDNTPSPQETLEPRQYSRLSAIRRPPRLDMDAVRKAEARGSLTSLPELIRRATKLAASLEKGKRPASRFDDLDYSGSEGYGVRNEKHQSGLSDMLAAFPPPAQPGANSSRRSIRNSIRDHVQSWPLPMNMRSNNSSREANAPDSDPDKSDKKQNRRCCGLPLWGFIVVMLVVLVILAAAVIIPIEFFVIRRQNNGNDAQASIQQCQQQLICANGGTNVVNNDVCSCICTGGFTGFDCTTAPSPGCTTFSLSGSDNMSNVTVGDAIPRLLQQAQGNFSIPLDGGQVIAKLNAANMSCTATNALVTFDGSAVRQGGASALAQVNEVNANAVVVNGVFWTTITIFAGQFTTITIDAQNPLGTPTATDDQGSTTRTVIPGTGTSVRPTTTITPTVTRTVTTTIPLSSGQTTVPTPTPGFKVTEEVLDFARVVVLYILQEESLRGAEGAQIALQNLFSRTSPVVGVEEARNVTVGEGGWTVDLVDWRVDLGEGLVGGTHEDG